MKRITITSISLCLVVFFCVEASWANLTIREFDAKRHDRFYVDVGGGAKAFIAEGYNFSGTGKASDNKWVTMISPTYFVSASHWHPDPSTGETITFYENNDPSGATHTHTIANWGYDVLPDGSGGSPNYDLWIGKLTEPVDTDKIACYSVLELPSTSDYIGRDLFVYGKPDRVGHNTIDFIDTSGGDDDKHMWFYYDTPGDPDEAMTETGDSGGASFTVCDGALTLIGIHHYGETDGGDSFIPLYIDALNGWMEADGSDERVTVVPEPATMILLSIGAMGMIIRRRHAKI